MGKGILSSFQIGHFQVTDYEIHVPVGMDTYPIKPNMGYTAGVNYGLNPDDKNMRYAVVALSFKLTEKEDINAEHGDDDFWAAICAQASFTCPVSDCTEDLFLQMLKRNGAGMMMSMTRSSMFSASAALGTPGVVLPSISVLAIDNWEIKRVDETE